MQYITSIRFSVSVGPYCAYFCTTRRKGAYCTSWENIQTNYYKYEAYIILQVW